MFGLVWLTPEIFEGICGLVITIITIVLKTLPPNPKITEIVNNFKTVLDDLFLAKSVLPKDWQEFISAIENAIKNHPAS